MITQEQLQKQKVPYFVVSDCMAGKRKGLPKKQRPAKVVGYTENDPLGVGGGLFPDNPTVHFETGGWVLITDLMRFHSIVSERWPNINPIGDKYE